MSENKKKYAELFDASVVIQALLESSTLTSDGIIQSLEKLSISWSNAGYKYFPQVCDLTIKSIKEIDGESK